MAMVPFSADGHCQCGQLGAVVRLPRGGVRVVHSDPDHPAQPWVAELSEVTLKGGEGWVIEAWITAVHAFLAELRL